MNTATIVVTALLALAVTGSAAATLTRQPTIVATVSGVGFPIEHLRALGVLKAVGVVGLCLGLLWPPVAVAAAAGLVGYFAAALVAHLRVRRYDIAPAAVFLALSVAALTLLVGELT